MTQAKANTTEKSAIYSGQVRHRRFGAIAHSFNYKLYMMGLDLDELALDEPRSNKTQLSEPVSNELALKDLAPVLSRSLIFGRSWFNPIRFNEKDYLKNEPGSLKQRIGNKVRSLGGDWQDIGRVFMLAQCRCMGIYFSPINFYFCYGSRGQCKYMLAEVSNTPWKQRHYYLLCIDEDIDEMAVQKAFHVSPFMAMDMMYRWRVSPPKDRVLVHIENHAKANADTQTHTGSKVFDASLALSKQAITSSSLLKTWMLTPAMTISMILGIYWQALKLFLKRVPFVAHPNSDNKTEKTQ